MTSLRVALITMAVAPSSVTSAGQGSAPEALRTRAERSDFTETSRSTT
jgi:hypothetical protein